MVVVSVAQTTCDHCSRDLCVTPHSPASLSSSLFSLVLQLEGDAGVDSHHALFIAFKGDSLGLQVGGWSGPLQAAGRPPRSSADHALTPA